MVTKYHSISSSQAYYLEIHRNPKQKEFLKSREFFLRLSHFLIKGWYGDALLNSTGPQKRGMKFQSLDVSTFKLYMYIHIVATAILVHHPLMHIPT